MMSKMVEKVIQWLFVIGIAWYAFIATDFVSSWMWQDFSKCGEAFIICVIIAIVAAGSAGKLVLMMEKDGE